MAETTQLTRHIESYVDTSSSSPSLQVHQLLPFSISFSPISTIHLIAFALQAASLNAIASLVKTDVLPLEALVREMGLYLTTTDNVIRARGILLLAEVITRVESKPLDSATIHSLVGFFKDRLGDGLIYGVCEAIDAEKDPECLMLAFHIVQSLAQLYPDSSGLLASFAKDIFDILEPYFPIHFTHPSNGDTHVQRDDLSRSLMSAFSSTPLFEPFVIPLLLEKLSSSLHSAKIDSLKYLRVCSSKYGAERIAKYAKSIWFSIKDTLSTYLGEPNFSLNMAPVDSIGFPENEFVMEALFLLQQLIVQNSSLLTSIIIDDEDVNIIFNTIASYEIYDAIPVQENKKLHAIGRILYIASKSTVTSCNAVYGGLSRMIDKLGVSVSNTDSSPNGDIFPSQRVKFGFLYLCIELLAGFRELIVGSDEPALQYAIEHATCCTWLHDFSSSLFNAFGSVLVASADRCPLDPDIYIGEFHESEKAMSYGSLVVEKIVEFLFLDDIVVPFSVKVEVLSNIGMTGMKNMVTCLQGMKKAVFSNLSKGLLDALIKTMKLSVGSCSVESQNLIIQNAYSILSSRTNFQLKELESLPLSPGKYNISLTDEGIISLFASVVIAVCPKTLIPNMRVLVPLFIVTLLRGIVPVAQALGSILNKLVSTSSSAENSSDITLEEALDAIFNTKLWFSSIDMLQRCNGTSNGKEIVLSDICLGFANDKLLQINAICGLSWIGKGLLLRGHEGIKDITITFLECLIPGTKSALPLVMKSEDQIQDPLVMKSAADAFHVLMSDSEVCLNKKFHATIRPLYKQRFFSSMMPILLQLIAKAYSSSSRSFLYRALAHVLSDTPMVAVLNDAKKLVPVLLDCLSMLTEDIQDKDLLYGLLLVLSGILTEKNGKEAVIENAHIIINCLIKLLDYPHKMTHRCSFGDYTRTLLLVALHTTCQFFYIFVDKNVLQEISFLPLCILVRETAIQCLVALSELPHGRIYPMRTQVLRAISKSLDDTKRVVRHEAVKCRQTWWDPSFLKFKTNIPRIFEIIRHLSDLFAACFVYPGQRGRAGPRLFAQFRPQDRSRSPKAHLHRARNGISLGNAVEQILLDDKHPKPNNGAPTFGFDSYGN
ncbi:MMS19 nucleotide excision repair protein-like protein [Vigna angularis]|uniref:MMS19 nucleotide excision repair protein n=1 Tax=Phaseolus angularis TaxID=3914 RepID=A0A8T0JEE2_PHAAN|nr:MMS19 nucleotide excision repair protein-like protein [Vigna angularis]